MLKKYKFLAMNRAGEIIYTSQLYETKEDAYAYGCAYLRNNKQVKEISIREIQ